jgi:hypothetical protein
MEKRAAERSGGKAISTHVTAIDERAAQPAYYAHIDAELSRLVDAPAPETPRPRKRRALKRTFDEVSAAMNAAVEAGDYDLVDQLADEMERIDQAETAAAAKAAQKAAAREAADRENNDRILALVESGYDPAEAESEVLGVAVESIRRRDFMAEARRDGLSGRSFDELIAGRVNEMIAQSYIDAENFTNGYMVKTAYKTKVDPRKLWTMNETTARKYMSDEMAEWFDQNGRITRQGYKDAVLAGRGGWRNAMTADFLQ